ncbi:MAG: DUF1345 domain-containing protein [Ktedonobacteraceae bacterium]|nr:DUF1345 domain-containing protein [Ktedonobacteraceae bacterium]
MQQAHQPPRDEAQEIAKMAPWWAAAIGALVLGGLFALLPESLTHMPYWLPLLLIVLIWLPFVAAHLLRRELSHVTARTLAFALLAIITVVLLISVAFLVISMANGSATRGTALLRDAGLLWVANVLVFSLWYWEIDGGGPRRRHQHGHLAADLLFPQQTDTITGARVWAPHYLDYLFVAFTAATALSPTDTMPLSRRAKALMMIEAVMAMAIVLVIAARAINIL